MTFPFMKDSIVKHVKIYCAVAAVALGIVSPVLCASNDNGGIPSYYGKIAQRVGRHLEKRHVLQHPLDDEISRRAWTNLVESYDSSHSIFLQSDLDALRSMETEIDDAIRAGDVSFGWHVRDVFRERLAECMDYVTNMIETTEFDFSQPEEYLWKRKDAPWPATDEERRAIWRGRIKNELLSQILTRELDAEDKARREAGESGTEETDTAATPDDSSDEELPSSAKLTPRENILKRYRQFATVMMEDDNETTLQRYLSAVTQAYDPHTDYLSPATKEDFDMDMNLTLCGIGATLTMDDGALKISEILPGSPVERDGRIKRGDKIVAVGQGDGPMEDILYKPMRQSIRKIRGPVGTTVALEIIPRTDPTGTERKIYRIVRDEIKLEEQAATGRVERVERGEKSLAFGYVKLPGFYGTMDKSPSDPEYRSATEDVKKYIAKFNAAEVDGMVLDLRGNGGGSLMEAVFLTALFEPPAPVVQIREAHRVYALPIPNDAANFIFRKPLVVLIDRASASASEIVATALQDTGRAIVLGDTQSHGKGTVQTVLPVQSGVEEYGSMKVTSARFYRITGSSTQVKGVSSDIVLPSVMDGLDIGEDKLPNALPWSRIEPVPYPRVWNLDTYIDRLLAMHEKRIAADETFAKRKELVKWFAESTNRDTVPIDRERRLAQMREERAMRRAADPDIDELISDDDEDISPLERRRRAANHDDPVLRESFQILADLSELTGGQSAPPPRKPEVPTWMKGIFF